FQAEDGIRDDLVTGVQTCALPISAIPRRTPNQGTIKRSDPINAMPLAHPLLSGDPLKSPRVVSDIPNKPGDTHAGGRAQAGRGGRDGAPAKPGRLARRPTTEGDRGMRNLRTVSLLACAVLMPLVSSGCI